MANHRSHGDEERLFTDFVRRWAQGEPAPAEAFDKAWPELVDWLRQELRRRGLWLLPASYLGIDSVAAWADSPDALSELATEAYLFVFVDRLVSLRACVTAGRSIEALVRRSLKNFVHDRHRDNDPLGSRTYDLVISAAEAATEAGELVAVPAEQKISSGTTLYFEADVSDREAVGRDRLCELVSGWADQLLPEFVTTSGRGIRRVLVQLRALFASLERHNVAAFRVKDVVGCLRDDLRPRWALVLSEQMGVDEEGAESRALVAFLSKRSIPGRELERRESFGALTDCVDRKLRVRSSESEQQEQLQVLWRLLVGWAKTDEVQLETDTDRSSRKTIEPRRAIPSQREISEWLSIPRDRLSSLYKILGELIGSCQAELAGRSAGRLMTRGSSHGPGAGSGGNAMDPEQRRASLLRLTAEALDRIENSVEKHGGRYPLAGGVFALSFWGQGDDETAEQPFVEWVVLSDEVAADGTVKVVPADTDPLAGGDDVAFSADSPSGALTLRSSLAFDAPARLFRSGRPSRRLGDDQLAQARAAQQRASGRSTAWLEDVAADLGPHYRDGLARVAEQVAVLNQAVADESEQVSDGNEAELESVDRGAPTEPIKRARSRPWLMPLAATLALFSVGLLIWGANLQRELERRDRPSVVREADKIRIGENLRAPIQVVLPANAEQVSLFFSSQAGALNCDQVRVEILDGTGTLIEEFEEITIDDAKPFFSIHLPRGFLEKMPTNLRVYENCPRSKTMVNDVELDVVLER